MKKLYFSALSIITSAYCWAQGPIITAIVDGDCTGGSPKFVEIYAEGAVDFTKYSLEKQSNSNTEWSNAQDLSALGTVTDAFVYIVKEDDLSIFNTEFPSATTHIISNSSAVDNNGDDRVRLIETATSTVIDQYGETDKDGTDTPWEYTDSYAKRDNGTKANAGTFNADNWTFGTPKALDGQGTCQEGTAFETIMSGIGDYNPTLSIAKKQISQFRLFPNPTNQNTVTINSTKTGLITVSLFDVLGKNVLNETLQNNTVNLSGLKNGLYLIKISQNGTSITKKLIKN